MAKCFFVEFVDIDLVGSGGRTVIVSLIGLYFVSPSSLRWSHEPEQMAVLEMAELVRRFWKLPRSLKILICPELKTPAAVGFLSPVILLPTEHFDDTDLELILHHEAAHLRRGDIIIKWCSMAVKCIYWFHPLVYLLCSQLENDLEAACDAAVMDKIGQEQEMQKYYSYLILDIAAGKSGRFYPFTTCLQDTKECLRARIDNIFDYPAKTIRFAGIGTLQYLSCYEQRIGSAAISGWNHDTASGCRAGNDCSARKFWRSVGCNH